MGKNRENSKTGFTMLELMVVIIIIGVLSSLAYAGMNVLIQTNRAKEAAREMTSFIERAIAEGKMLQKTVTISINGVKLEVKDENAVIIDKTLANGFSFEEVSPLPEGCGSDILNKTVESKNNIGISGVSAGCFVVCNSGYCGSAVKKADKNTFTAWIKKKSGWEAI